MTIFELKEALDNIEIDDDKDVEIMVYVNGRISGVLDIDSVTYRKGDLSAYVCTVGAK